MRLASRGRSLVARGRHLSRALPSTERHGPLRIAWSQIDATADYRLPQAPANVHWFLGTRVSQSDRASRDPRDHSMRAHSQAAKQTRSASTDGRTSPGEIEEQRRGRVERVRPERATAPLGTRGGLCERASSPMLANTWHDSGRGGAPNNDQAHGDSSIRRACSCLFTADVPPYPLTRPHGGHVR
jgi:hypothetical protein